VFACVSSAPTLTSVAVRRLRSHLDHVEEWTLRLEISSTALNTMWIFHSCHMCVRVVCLLSSRRYPMARKAGQLISRGRRTWLVRVSLGRDPETGTRKYHNRTIRGSFREAQTYLNTKLQERGIGCLLRAAAISLNQYLDQWLTTAAKP